MPEDGVRLQNTTSLARVTSLVGLMQQDGQTLDGRIPLSALAVQLAGTSPLNSIMASAGFKPFATKAAIDADLAYASKTIGWVYADATVENNGIYVKAGNSGSGSWSRVLPLPYSFARTVTTAGTVNALAVTTDVPVSDKTMVLLSVNGPNTASPVTVAFNGGPALTIKTASGGNVPAGALVSGLGYISGSNFRLVTDIASAAIQAAAEAAAAAAQAAADSVASVAGASALSISAADMLLKKLEAGIADATLAFLSDSTLGIDQANSPGLRIINALAARYPAYRVIMKEWDTATVAYKADVQLQAGIGGSPKVLTVYLGAAPGYYIQYAKTNFAAMYPVAADLVIINFGYNQSEVVTPNPPSFPGYRSLYLSLIKMVQNAGVRTGIMVTAQPPKKTAGSTDNAARDRHATLQVAVQDLAATERLGLIDVFSAFRQTANYEALLIGPDGIHPLTAGYNLWYDVFLAQFPLKGLGTPALPARTLDRIIKGANEFGFVQGSAGSTYALEDSFFNRTGFVLTFGDASLGGYSSWVTLPDHWENFNLSILWGMASAVVGSVVWSVDLKLLDLAAAAGSGAKVMTGFTSTGIPGGNFPAPVPGSRGLAETKIVSGYALPRGGRNILMPTLFRRGSDGSDTAVGNAEFHAMIFERI